MILQALCQLAQQEELIEDPDFEVKPVAWIVHLRQDGTLLQIVDRRQNLNGGTNRQPKWEGLPMLVPRQGIRANKDFACFMVDKSEYVLGFDPTGARPAEKLLSRLQLFQEQIDLATAGTDRDESLLAVARFLCDIGASREIIEAAFAASPWAPNDLFAFRVGLSDEDVHLRPAVRAYWKRLRTPASGSVVQPHFRCLVTGLPVDKIDLFPKLKKVPGGNPAGVSLVSFNASAFESYGLKSNENAPISRAAAEQSATALNRLLHDAFPNPRELGTTLPRRNVRLSADTVVCFWAASAGAEATEFSNALFDLLTVETEASVGNVYRSLWQGREAEIRDPSAFYVLILSGSQGRAVVRDWIETTLAETCQHLASHFQDLKIVRNTPPKKGTLPSPALPLRALMDSLAPEGSSEQLPPSLEAGFMRAAFLGPPYSFQVLQRALVRTRAEAGRDDWIDLSRRDARAALLKAVLNRRRRCDPKSFDSYPEVPETMNPLLQSEGYSLGLLMAVLERLQLLALGNVNASVVDRFFSAASATPRSVFVRLLKNSQHHTRKALDSDDVRDRVLTRRLTRLIDDVCSRFQLDSKQYPPRAQGIPAHLALEQQALFVLGYHQMRHWLWMNTEDRKKWEDEHPDAPEVFVWSKREKTETGAEAGAAV